MRTKQAQAAAELRADAFAQLERIRNDASLSEWGRRAKITEVSRAAKDGFRKLRREEHAVLSARRGTLEAELFGTAGKLSGSAMIAYRDAADRAAAARTADDAGTLLRRALTAGDGELANAVARQAVERSWPGVFDLWRDNRREQLPNVDEIVAELSDIDHHFDRTNTEVAAAWMPPSAPEEFRSEAEAKPPTDHYAEAWGTG